jgi:hypothetical protein
MGWHFVNVPKHGLIFIIIVWVIQTRFSFNLEDLFFFAFAGLIFSFDDAKIVQSRSQYCIRETTGNEFQPLSFLPSAGGSLFEL